MFSESYILGSFVRTAMSIKSRTFKCVGINKGRLWLNTWKIVDWKRFQPHLNVLQLPCAIQVLLIARFYLVSLGHLQEQSSDDVSSQEGDRTGQDQGDNEGVAAPSHVCVRLAPTPALNTTAPPKLSRNQRCSSCPHLSDQLFTPIVFSSSFPPCPFPFRVHIANFG